MVLAEIESSVVAVESGRTGMFWRAFESSQKHLTVADYTFSIRNMAKTVKIRMPFIRVAILAVSAVAVLLASAACTPHAVSMSIHDIKRRLIHCQRPANTSRRQITTI